MSLNPADKVALVTGSATGNGWDRYKEADPEGCGDHVGNILPMARLGRLGKITDALCFLVSPRASGLGGRNVRAVEPGKPPAAVRIEVALSR